MIPENPAIAGIILAAGTSSRMGRVKQLLPLGGKTLLGHVVETALGSSLAQVIVVLGNAAEIICRRVDLTSVSVVINKDYRRGQSTSLQAGLGEVQKHIQGAMFILGDQPLVDISVVETLIRTFHQGRPFFVVPTYRGRRGNPVIVNRLMFSRLMALRGDQGARGLFEHYQHGIKRVEVQHQGVLWDIDTWEDYHEVRTMLDKTGKDKKT